MTFVGVSSFKFMLEYTVGYQLPMKFEKCVFDSLLEDFNYQLTKKRYKNLVEIKMGN